MKVFFELVLVFFPSEMVIAVHTNSCMEAGFSLIYTMLPLLCASRKFASFEEWCLSTISGCVKIEACFISRLLASYRFRVIQLQIMCQMVWEMIVDVCFEHLVNVFAEGYN